MIIGLIIVGDLDSVESSLEQILKYCYNGLTVLSFCEDINDDVDESLNLWALEYLCIYEQCLDIKKTPCL